MKLLKVKGVIQTPDNLNTDVFIDEYVKLVRGHKCYSDSGFDDVTSQEEAYKYSSNHRENLMKDEICGCFHCLKVFHPTEITNWLNEGSGTALCPYCGVDSVIGESSGYPIKKEFLEKMRKYWF